jgi:hypothetical protein
LKTESQAAVTEGGAGNPTALVDPAVRSAEATALNNPTLIPLPNGSALSCVAQAADGL